MEIDTAATSRLLLLFGHLLLCVFALQAVLSGDFRLLLSRMDAPSLNRAHHRLSWLLAGLWASGLGIVALDTGMHGPELAARPKLLAKLVCVSVLTANSFMLRLWCFPRIVGGRPLGLGEAMALMAFGAISTTSWLMAAFYGIARPLNGWSVAENLTLYGGVLAMALLSAVALAGHLRRQKPLGPAATALRLGPCSQSGG